MTNKEKIACVIGAIYVSIMVYVLYYVMTLPREWVIRPSWMI
jgi:hypothetical protein